MRGAAGLGGGGGVRAEVAGVAVDVSRDSYVHSDGDGQEGTRHAPLLVRGRGIRVGVGRVGAWPGVAAACEALVGVEHQLAARWVEGAERIGDELGELVFAQPEAVVVLVRVI